MLLARSLKHGQRVQAIVDALVLAGLPLALIFCAVYQIKASALITFTVALGALGIYFIGWEHSRPALRQVMPPVVLASVASAGRIVCVALPNIQPVTAICVICGAVFGRRSGFMCGALSALVSNCFLGQGIWTPWQMYAWGLVGYLAGVFFCGRSASVPSRYQKVLVCVYGFAASFLFGALMNTWSAVGFVHPITWQVLVAVYGAGFVFDMAHALSTVVFLALLYVPWSSRLTRVAKRL